MCRIHLQRSHEAGRKQLMGRGVGSGRHRSLQPHALRVTPLADAFRDPNEAQQIESGPLPSSDDDFELPVAGLGLAWTFHWYYSLLFFLGAVVGYGFEKKTPKMAEEYTYPIASGIIAGGS